MALGEDLDLDVRADRGCERGREAVVVGLWQRIELVVVAAGTSHGEPEHGGADRRDDVVELAAAGTFKLLLRQLRRKRTGRQESGSDPGGGNIGGEFVAGQLPAEEGVKGEVVVEGRDDEVSVGMGVGAVVILLVAEALGVAGHVEPGLRLALAEGWPAEKIVDFLLVGLVATVVDESPDFTWGRRQPRQISGEATTERATVGHGSRREARLPDPGEDEAVDRIATPAIGVVDGGHGDGRQGQKRPPPAEGRIDRPLRPRATVCRIDERTVVRGTSVNPLRQTRQDLGGERIPLLRHVWFLELRGQPVEQTLRAPPRDDRRTTPAAGEQRLPRGEIEAPFVGVTAGAVASGAAVDEHVAEPHEEFEATGIGARLIAAGDRRPSGGRPDDEHDADQRCRQPQAVPNE